MKISVMFVSTSGFSWKTRSTLLVAAALSIDGEFTCDQTSLEGKLTILSKFRGELFPFIFFSYLHVKVSDILECFKLFAKTKKNLVIFFKKYYYG